MRFFVALLCKITIFVPEFIMPCTMTDNKISIERELHSKSAKIIWALMSTPEGLSKWFADDVKREGDLFVFTWGNSWSSHETRTASMLERKEQEYIRLRWSEEEYADTYFELRIAKSDITGDYILMITDFAPDGDTDSLEDLWDANMDTLHRSTGL